MSGELDKMNAGNAMMMRLLRFKEDDNKAKAKIEASRTEEAPEIKDISVAKKQEKLLSQKPDSFGTVAPETKVTFAYQDPTIRRDTQVAKQKPPAPDKLSNSDANAA